MGFANGSTHTVSQIDFAPPDTGTAQIQISADKWRAAKSSKNAACLRRFFGDRLIDGRPNLGRIGAVIRKPTCQRSDQVAIAVEPKHLKARQPTLAEPRPVIPDGTLL
jgi:hypothetical protein